MSKYRKDNKKIPAFLYVLIGVSIMFIVCRTMFWSELNIEMDIMSIFIPAYTLGCLSVYWMR